MTARFADWRTEGVEMSPPLMQGRSLMIDPLEVVDLVANKRGIGEYVVYTGPRYYAESLLDCYTIKWGQHEQLEVRRTYKTVEQLFGLDR